jgi:anti-sigma factor RsiW
MGPLGTGSQARWRHCTCWLPGEKLIHPDIETLVRYRDEELAPNLVTVVEAHLAKCDSCRLDFHRLRAALTEVRRLSAQVCPEGSLAGIWEGIRQRIGAWETTRRNPEQSDEAVRNRVARQIAPFLGNAAALRVLEPVRGNHQHLLSTVEGVLSEFLGPGAAAVLVNRVIDSAIVKV